MAQIEQSSHMGTKRSKKNDEGSRNNGKKVVKKSKNDKGSRNNGKEVINLCDDVLHNIFSFLPLEVAFKVGATNARFARSWVLNRNLNFDRDFGSLLTHERYVFMVDGILKSHIGTKVHSFKLYLDPSHMFHTVEKWIHYVVMKEVEVIDFDFYRGKELFKLPQFLSSCRSLTSLKLFRCIWETPTSSMHLSNLTVVVLEKVHLTDKMIGILFNDCVNLENLELVKCTGLYKLNICAINKKKFRVLKVANCSHLLSLYVDSITLTSFIFCGCVHQFRITGDFSKLNDAMICFNSRRGFQKVENILSDFNHVKFLTLNSSFIEDLRRARIQLFNLKEFQLSMEHTSFCNPYDIVHFLQNCPCLERLFIDLGGFSFQPNGYYWELFDKGLFENFMVKFKFLKSIKIKGFKLQKYEVDLVKVMLEKSEVLETLALITPRSDPQKSIFECVNSKREIFLSWRSSQIAQVVVFPYSRDFSRLHPKHNC